MFYKTELPHMIVMQENLLGTIISWHQKHNQQVRQ